MKKEKFLTFFTILFLTLLIVVPSFAEEEEEIKSGNSLEKIEMNKYEPSEVEENKKVEENKIEIKNFKLPTTDKERGLLHRNPLQIEGEKREKIREEMKEKIEDRRKKIKEKMESLKKERDRKLAEFKEKLEKIKDQRKREIVERISKRLNELNQRRVKVLEILIERLEKLFSKLESVMQKIGERGGDISLAKTKLEELKQALADFSARVEEQKGKEYIIEIKDEQSLGQAVGSAYRSLISDLRSLRHEFIDIKKKLREVIVELKKARPVPTVTTEPEITSSPEAGI